MEGFEECRGWDRAAVSYGSRDLQPSQTAQELITGRGISPRAVQECVMPKGGQCQGLLLHCPGDRVTSWWASVLPWEAKPKEG